MISGKIVPTAIATIVLVVVVGIALAAQDKYALKVPNGLAFSEFRGYESWPVIAISENNGVIAAIVGNPTMIDAYKKGIPGNGMPFPDGARMAKIHWKPKKNALQPGQPTQPGTLLNVDFMVKDNTRFVDSGGWGWAAFDYEPVTNTFAPATLADHPPQGNNAKCGFACHTEARKSDYVFTAYAKR